MNESLKLNTRYENHIIKHFDQNPSDWSDILPEEIGFEPQNINFDNINIVDAYQNQKVRFNLKNMDSFKDTINQFYDDIFLESSLILILPFLEPFNKISFIDLDSMRYLTVSIFDNGDIKFEDFREVSKFILDRICDSGLYDNNQEIKAKLEKLGGSKDGKVTYQKKTNQTKKKLLDIRKQA